jgi:hypothetical protein
MDCRIDSNSGAADQEGNCIPTNSTNPSYCCSNFYPNSGICTDYRNSTKECVIMDCATIVGMDSYFRCIYKNDSTKYDAIACCSINQP